MARVKRSVHAKKKRREVLEAAVPLAGGKVLINSVTAEQHSMDRLLPLVAAHARP